MTGQADALLLAAAFTFGCAALYEMRLWVRDLAGILLRVALCLAPVVIAVALSRLPAAQRPSSTGMLRSATPALPNRPAGGAESGPTPRTARSAR
jgi:hypothetical protein